MNEYAIKLAKEIIKGTYGLDQIDDENILLEVKKILKKHGFSPKGHQPVENTDIDKNKYFTLKELTAAAKISEPTCVSRLKDKVLETRYVKFIKGKGRSGKNRLICKDIMNDSRFMTKKKVHQRGFILPDNNSEARIKGMREKAGGFFKNEVLQAEEIIDKHIEELQAKVDALKMTLEIIKHG
jgi:hypothetical protein